MAFGGLKGTLTGNGASIGTSNSIAGSVVVAVGDLVFAVLGQQTNLTATTASDNLGNAYTAQNAGTDAGAATGRAYWSIVTVAGTLSSVAIAASSSTNDWCGFAAVIEGPFLVNASQPDKNIANATGDLASPFTCPATGTLGQANEVIMCWMASDGSASWLATSPNLKAGQVANSTNIKVIIGYQAVSSTSTVSPEFTGTNPTVDVLGTITFKKADTQALTPGLFTNSQTFYAPTVSPGAVALTPGLFTNSQTFYAPTVTPGAVALTPGLVTNSQTFHAPAVLSICALTVGLVSNAQTFYAPIVAPGSVDVVPGLVTNTQTFYAPTISATYGLAPTLVTNDQTFHAPSATSTYGLLPDLLTNASAFHAPIATLGAVDLGPGLVTNSQTFHAPSANPGAVNLAPDLFANSQSFFAANVEEEISGGGSATPLPSGMLGGVGTLLTR